MVVEVERWELLRAVVAERPVSSASSTLSSSTKNRRQRSVRSKSIHSHHSEFLPRYRMHAARLNTYE